MTFLHRVLHSFALAALIAALPASPMLAQSGEYLAEGVAGALLSGRLAVSDSEFRQMAESYDSALAGDPDNPMFRELAMQGNILSGNFDRAFELAEQAERAGESGQIAHVILQAGEFRRGDYDDVIANVQEGRLTGPLSDAMAVAWAELGRGSMSDALTAFEAAMEERAELAPFALYHKGLALALVGDLEGAADILAGDPDAPVNLSRRGVVAQMTILSQLGRFEAARELGEQMFGSTPDDDVARIMAALEQEAPVPFTTISSARDGMAEVYFTLSSALVGDRSDWLPIIYGQLVLALRPDHADAILLTGQLLERVDQHELADQVYDLMPPDNPQYLGAQLGRANALYQSGQPDAAIDSLFALAEARPDSLLVFSSLGDMLRREERYDEAAAAYSTAIDLIDEIEERHWVLLYTRAISYERMGEWNLAEPEFRRVLDFVPDEPQVLNYLGYSLVEQRRNLDEALEMIERAVEGEPDSGYIVDSLGWAYYRLGRYEEAVPVMERAVELMPTDPILNDHLGDVYWAVGREREARFQWRRALSFGPHADMDSDLVRRKLEIGKDAALKEQDAAE